MLEGFLTSSNGKRTAAPGTRNGEGGADRRSDGGTGAAEAEDERVETLNTLLANPNFRASPRNKRFLEFVVKETVAGRAERIKAFTVAVDVFGRSADFDPLSDPIVRISAGHLRRALDTYYESHGKADSMRIHLPRGTYVPVFEERETLPRRMLKRVSALTEERRRHLTSGAVGALMALSAAGAAIGYLSLGAVGQQKQFKPVVVVDTTRVPPGEDATEVPAHLFIQSLWIALGRERAIRMIGVRPEENLSAVLQRTRADLAGDVPLYLLLTTVQPRGKVFHVYWHILDGRSNEAYFSASASGPVAPGEHDAASQKFAGMIATSLKRLPDRALPETEAEDAAVDARSGGP